VIELAIAVLEMLHRIAGMTYIAYTTACLVRTLQSFDLDDCRRQAREYLSTGRSISDAPITNGTRDPRRTQGFALYGMQGSLLLL
jgi:hypothetical protein